MQGYIIGEETTCVRVGQESHSKKTHYKGLDGGSTISITISNIVVVCAKLNNGRTQAMVIQFAHFDMNP